jgi:hypothetical protein
MAKAEAIVRCRKRRLGSNIDLLLTTPQCSLSSAPAQGLAIAVPQSVRLYVGHEAPLTKRFTAKGGTLSWIAAAARSTLPKEGY